MYCERQMPHRKLYNNYDLAVVSVIPVLNLSPGHFLMFSLLHSIIAFLFIDINVWLLYDVSNDL